MLLLGLASSGCDDGTNPNLDSYEVSGRVTDIETGEGIANASVVFTSDTLFTASTQTGDGGHYAMLVETDSPYGRVRAEKSGYAPATESVFFDSAVRRVDVEMNPTPAP